MTSWRLRGPDATEMKIFAFEPGLDRLADEILGDRFEDTKDAGDRHQLGVEFLAQHPRARPAERPRQRTAAQRAIYMYAPVGHDLRARPDQVRHDEVAVPRVHALARADRFALKQSERRGRLGRRDGNRHRRRRWRW